MNIAVLSNINMDPLKTLLPSGKYYFCGYGQYMQALLGQDAACENFAGEAMFLHLDGEELIKPLAITRGESPGLNALMDKQLDLIFGGIQEYHQRHPHAVIIFSTVVLSPMTVLNYLDTNSGISYRALENHINERIIDFCREAKHIYTLDWQRVVLQQGYEQVVDEKFWYLGRIKYANKAFKIMARHLCQLLDAIAGKTKKVLVLDGDNTLWGGIVGEEGAAGINISEDGVGKAYRDFQISIKGLSNLGVLLAFNSKNNPEDVQEVFDSNPMMVLKKEDFVIAKINWESKARNMKEMAEELNLGLDSFVFIDDDPRERAGIREQLPEVIVPEFPSDPALLKSWFVNEVVFSWFPKVSITSEDTHKAVQYKALGQRNEFLKTLDGDDFIKHLGVKAGFYVNDPRFVQRTVQLIQKTNQFNMTGRRYTPGEIEGFFKTKDTIVFNADYKDRFGEEGIIGVAIVRLKAEYACIDSFLMSCRVIGKSAEYLFLGRVLEHLKKQSVRTIKAEFIPSPKNSVARDFFKNAGFLQEPSKGTAIHWQAETGDLCRHLQKKYPEAKT